ncbi:branched-chain amino acid ABC transporter permease [Mesorhizobium koreense]|jgi:branched-chain amino acid transport system permease protein|uniref:branched-chain amino acid ABC transporter permease n=1 Tax=Mesorhizobium koreense TaxID=3074855 RepID=UPI00287BA457|nr:branched-chain amino acid ABC transporter permease [Mesorhizobium sp. WR6]
MLNFVQTLVAGLLIGGVYALVSIGLSLILGVMRIINFAQGEFMMLAMYFTYFVTAALGVSVFADFVGPLVAAMLAGPVMYIVGILVYRVLLRHVSGTSSGGQDAQLLITLGISLILQNAALMAFGPTAFTLHTSLSADIWKIGPIIVNRALAIAFGVSIVLTAGFYVFMSRFRAGKILRACADNPQAAVYMGLDPHKAHARAFGIGVGLTAIAGGLVATYYPFTPYIGLNFIVIMFVAVVLGGLGSTTGAFFGGLIVGVVQQLWTLVMPMELQDAGVFLLFLLILFFRPQGLFGKKYV